jgi:hypothetical protein
MAVLDIPVKEEFSPTIGGLEIRTSSPARQS